MKKYILIPITLFATSLFAQFNINGQIDNYASKPILVKIYENGIPKTIQNVKTDYNGNFTTKIPVAYNGAIKLEFPSGGSIDLYSENENLKFKTL